MQRARVRKAVVTETEKVSVKMTLSAAGWILGVVASLLYQQSLCNYFPARTG